MAKFTVDGGTSQGEETRAGRPVDDWLGDESEIDWEPARTGGTDRRAPSQSSATRRAGGRQPTAGPADDEAEAAARIIWRRRAVALGVGVGVFIVAVIVALVAFGGGSDSPTAATTSTTTPVTTTTPATTTAPQTTTTTPGSASGSTAPATITLPDAGKLKTGDNGAEVKAVQQGLTTLGYDPGKVDGIYGPLTEQAVIAFQTAKKLDTDGVVGPKTVAAMNEALAQTG